MTKNIIIEQTNNQTINAKLAVAYERYSSAKQDDGYSIEAQKSAINDYAENHGISIVKHFSDLAKTGRNDNRTALKSMMNFLEQNPEVRYLLIHKRDRLFRNRAMIIEYGCRLEKMGVRLTAVAQDFGSTPEGYMMTGITDVWSEYYSQNLSKETMKGMKEKAKAYKHCGGQPPLGFSVDANGDYHINQSEAVIVRDLFDMYANGMSYNEILKVFDEKNYRTRSGKPFGKNSFYELLHNPKMMGTYVFNRRSSKSRYSQTSNSHLNKPNEEMIIKTNAIPAIVSPQLFDKVQKRLKQNKDRRGANKAKQRYLLSSKVVCGECGCNFHGNSRKNGKGIVYSSYRCNKKNMTGKCGNTEISREHLEKYVLEHLRKMLLTKEVKKRVIAEVAKYRRMTNDSARQEEKRYKNELIGVQKKIENIVNVIAQGNTIDSLTDKLKELEQNKKSLEQSLANLDVKYSDITITEQQYDEAVSKLDEFMQANTYDFNVINFIDKCVDKIVVYKDYVEVTFMVTSFLMGESTRYVKIRVTATRNEVMGRHRSYKNNIYVPPTERNIDIFVE